MQGTAIVASDEFAEFLREQLAPVGHVTMRRMFGKTGVFCDGVMLGMVTENTLYLRVDEGNRAAFKEAEAFPPLNYRKQGELIDLSFWRVPVAAVRRTRRICRVGADSARGRAPGRGEGQATGSKKGRC